MMTKKTLYIVRHGQTEWNVQKRMQGHQDSALTLLGEQQAQWLGNTLDSVNFDCIYTSPSTRAVRTAEIIDGKAKTPIIKTDLLKEINLGKWEGQKQEDIKKQDPEQFDAFWETPHLFQANSGESLTDVQDRVLPKIKDIIDHHKGTDILIVTHTVVVKIVMAYFENRAFRYLEPPLYSSCMLVYSRNRE